MQKLEFIRLSPPFLDSDEGQHPNAEFRLSELSVDPDSKITTLRFAAYSSETDTTPINGTQRFVKLTDSYFRDPIVVDGVVIDYGFPSFNYVWSMIQTDSKGVVSIIAGKEAEIFAFLLNEKSLNVRSNGTNEEKLGDGWQMKITT